MITVKEKSKFWSYQKQYVDGSVATNFISFPIPLRLLDNSRGQSPSSSNEGLM